MCIILWPWRRSLSKLHWGHVLLKAKQPLQPKFYTYLFKRKEEKMIFRMKHGQHLSQSLLRSRPCAKSTTVLVQGMWQHSPGTAMQVRESTQQQTVVFKDIGWWLGGKMAKKQWHWFGIDKSRRSRCVLQQGHMKISTKEAFKVHGTYQNADWVE